MRMDGTIPWMPQLLIRGTPRLLADVSSANCELQARVHLEAPFPPVLALFTSDEVPQSQIGQAAVINEILSLVRMSHCLVGCTYAKQSRHHAHHDLKL